MSDDMYDLHLIRLSREAEEAFNGVEVTAISTNRDVAFSSAIEELRAADLVQRLEAGLEWYLCRTGKGRAWGRWTKGEQRP